MSSRSKKLDQDLSDIAEVVETSSDEEYEDTEVVLDLNDESIVKQIEVFVESGELKFLDWTYLKPSIDELNTTSIRDLIEYSQSVIDRRRQSETEELERQMLEIQAKLLTLKGPSAVGGNVNKSGKTARPIINPNNPSQIYKFGKHPKWLTDLVAEQTVKDPSNPTYQIMDELREESKAMM